MKILGIIPSRYASTRFPGKPLADIKGKSMIQRVYEQSRKSKRLHEVIVATDDKRIFDHVLSFGGKVIMTSPEHQSGTDRCYETLTLCGQAYDAVVNIQGDEPFIDPQQIDTLCECLSGENVQLATLVRKTDDPSEIHNINRIKVVLDKNNHALYFSRAAIPFMKGTQPGEWGAIRPYWMHIGIYGYRSETLKEITSLPVSGLEKAESLEQLRWLENGYRIKVAETTHESVSVDTPEDLEMMLRKI